MAALDEVPREERLARKQVAHPPREGGHEGGDYNIWYHKRAGERGGPSREPATTRCRAAADAGRTKGGGAADAGGAVCLFFARGACYRGHACDRRHAVPGAADDAALENDRDVFGRPRDARDTTRDGGYGDGVGCVLRENRTLWVGGLGGAAEQGALEAALRAEFGEWGEIGSVRLAPAKGCAFVRFAHRASAEFAKEAMANQSLGGTGGTGGGPARAGESRPGARLVVKWASEDPNPRALALARRARVWERPLGLGGVWGPMIREWLDALVPPGDDGGGRVALLVTLAGGGGGDADRGFARRVAPWLPRKALRVVAPSAFASRAELIDVALASAHVPFFLDGRARARWAAAGAAIDGSLGLLLGGDAARAELDAAIRAGEVLSPPPGRVAAPVWLEHGADAAFAATVRQSDFLRLVSPEGLYAMVDAGRAAVRRRHEARDPELAVLGAASSGAQRLARH